MAPFRSVVVTVVLLATGFSVLGCTASKSMNECGADCEGLTWRETHPVEVTRSECENVSTTHYSALVIFHQSNIEPTALGARPIDENGADVGLYQSLVVNQQISDFLQPEGTITPCPGGTCELQKDGSE